MDAVIIRCSLKQVMEAPRYYHLNIRHIVLCPHCLSVPSNFLWRSTSHLCQHGEFLSWLLVSWLTRVNRHSRHWNDWEAANAWSSKGQLLRLLVEIFFSFGTRISSSVEPKAAGMGCTDFPCGLVEVMVNRSTCTSFLWFLDLCILLIGNKIMVIDLGV